MRCHGAGARAGPEKRSRGLTFPFKCRAAVCCSPICIDAAASPIPLTSIADARPHYPYPCRQAAARPRLPHASQPGRKRPVHAVHVRQRLHRHAPRIQHGRGDRALPGTLQPGGVSRGG